MNSKFEFRSSILTDNNHSILVNFKDRTFDVETKIKTYEEEKVVDEVIDFSKLRGKRNKINSLLKMTLMLSKNSSKFDSEFVISRKKEDVIKCAICSKFCKNSRGLQIHIAWHKKHNK